MSGPTHYYVEKEQADVNVLNELIKMSVLEFQ
jgi:hypothetical protein